jgi:hypothetical protein
VRIRICIFVCGFVALACGNKDKSPAESSPSASSAPPASAAKAGAAPAADPPPVKAADPGSAVVLGPEAPAFKVVDKPSAADVPNTPVVGSANGRKYEPKTVLFEPDAKGWRMILSDKPLDKPSDLIRPGSQTIYLSLLATKVSAGQKFSRAKANGDGYFQIAQPEDPTKTTSWNTVNAYYVEITKWDVSPYDPKLGMSQQAGKASGKIYVAHDANAMSEKRGFKDSGVAGTFTDAIVRYKGEPKF